MKSSRPRLFPSLARLHLLRQTRGALNGGFTIMEVLVALAIFALMAVVLGGSYVNVLNSYAAAARDRATDEDAAFALQLLLAEPDVEKARQGDQFDSTEGRHVVWSATIDPTTTPDLFTVTYNCEVSAIGQNEAFKMARTFTLLRPSWSDPAERAKLLQDTKDRIAEIQSKTANGFVPAAPAPAATGGLGNAGARGKNGKTLPGAGAGTGGTRGNGAVNPRGPARNDGTVPTPPPSGTNPRKKRQPVTKE